MSASITSVTRHDWSLAEVKALFEQPFNDLLFQAQTVHRAHFDPNRVQVSTLLSIKTGACPEDCSYCSQSIRFETGLKSEPLMDLGDVMEKARAAKARWSPHQLLEQLAQEEIAERSRRSLERRLRFSGIKRFKPMADFEWSWPTKIERDVIERALTLDFLAEARNLVLVGRNGLGKTMIAQNLCHAAVLAGYSVLFRSATALLEELHRQSPDGRRYKMRTYASVGLLCID